MSSSPEYPSQYPYVTNFLEYFLPMFWILTVVSLLLGGFLTKWYMKEGTTMLLILSIMAWLFAVSVLLLSVYETETNFPTLAPQRGLYSGNTTHSGAFDPSKDPNCVLVNSNYYWVPCELLPIICLILAIISTVYYDKSQTEKSVLALTIFMWLMFGGFVCGIGLVGASNSRGTFYSCPNQ